MDFDTQHWESELANYYMDTETILEFFTTKEILGEGTYHELPIMMTDVGPAIWYLDHLYIEVIGNEYVLVLEQEEWHSKCLKRLEIKLARYAVEDGFIDRDEFLTRMDEILGRHIGVIPEEYRGNDYRDDED